MNNILTYKYNWICLKCNSVNSFYVFYDDVLAGNVECKCGYKGIADCKLEGRYWRSKWTKNGPLLTDRVIDDGLSDEEWKILQDKMSKL